MNRNKLFVWATVIVLVAGLAYLVTRPATMNKDVENQEAKEAIAKGARIIDVRTPEEYALAHLPGSENVPPEQIAQAAASWDRNAVYLLYCATGSRSRIAADWMAANGFGKVLNLRAGIVAWDGETTQDSASGPSPVVETNGKPVFLEFSSTG